MNGTSHEVAIAQNAVLGVDLCGYPTDILFCGSGA
jgi:hypothetical protein